MKQLFFLVFLFCFSKNTAQQLHLSIASNKNELEIIDSIGYKKRHIDAKSIVDETNLLSEKLSKIGYIENEILKKNKQNDSTFVINYRLGQQIKYIHLNQPSRKDTLKIAFNKIESFLQKQMYDLEKQGYGLSKVQLINIEKKKDFLIADLQIVNSKKRNITDFVIKGYDKFAQGFKKSLFKKYRNLVFNQENLKKINADFNSIRFVKQTKYPEILFTTDSTKIYVYLEKAKSNAFDGFIGFSNDDKGNLIFNGYLDLTLNNALHVGEKMAVYWKSDGKNQKTINLGLEIPYIFNSPIAIKTHLNIFKQDSIFQNTKTEIDMGYYLNHRSKIYLGFQSTESNDLKNTNSEILSDFNNQYYTGKYEFLSYKNDDTLFPEKINFSFQLGTGSRNTKRQSVKQSYGSLFLNYHAYLTKKTAINIKSQNFYLNSDNFIVNELMRFGGINSIRGFNENALQANSFTAIMTEYQYIISQSLYLHSIFDYGYYKDTTTDSAGKLLGIGIGFGLLTKNGILNLVYANGTIENQFSNSIIHISLKTVF